MGKESRETRPYIHVSFAIDHQTSMAEVANLGRARYALPGGVCCLVVGRMTGEDWGFVICFWLAGAGVAAAGHFLGVAAVEHMRQGLDTWFQGALAAR